MVTGILNLVHGIFRAVSPCIAVTVPDGRQPPATVGAEHIPGKHRLPFGLQSDMALFLILVLPLLQDVKNLVVCIITAEPQRLQLGRSRTVLQSPAIEGIPKDTDHFNACKLSPAAGLVPLFIKEVRHPVRAVPLMDRHIVNHMEHFAVRWVDLILLDLRTLTVHKAAVRQTIPKLDRAAGI